MIGDFDEFKPLTKVPVEVPKQPKIIVRKNMGPNGGAAIFQAKFVVHTADEAVVPYNGELLVFQFIACYPCEVLV